MKKLGIILLVLFTTTAYAADQTVDFNGTSLSKSDQDIADKALSSSADENWPRAREIATQARDRLVQKIIIWREIKNARNANLEEVKQFVTANPGWPLHDSFKRRVGLAPPQNNQNDSWKAYASKARDLIEAGHPEDAYELISGRYKYLSDSNRADALWLSGWINLRYLKDPVKAAAYFERLYADVRLPVSLSRAAYWAGRSYEALNDDSHAAAWYKKGADHYATFYGQLSALKLDRDYDLTLPDYGSPDYSDAKNFLADERVRAAKILDQAGDNEDARLFLIKYLDEEQRTVSDYMLVVLLAQQTTNYEWAVMAGKKAADVFVQVPQANYPVLVFTPPAPEKALVMAITRQESQLNRFAKSSVGALGMMQLMPATAQNVAKMVNAPYSSNMLFDKDYNMTLGSYYLNKRVGDLGGSYILAIAAYNGGIGNVILWLKRFGDPRKMDLDQIVDWIELIPFAETRNYVQRVLEATQVYRARLNGGSHRLELTKDLQRHNRL